MLIDTTGDLDVMRRAGVPCVAGQNFATYIGKQITLEGCKRALEKQNVHAAYSNVAGYSATLWGTNQPEGVPFWSGLTCEEVSDYVIRNQTEMLKHLKKDDRLSRDVAMVPLMPQFRTSCCLKGDYTFTVDDVYKHFDDSVCAINDFEYRDFLYEVPLRALTRKDYPNMLTAGRCASAEGYGWDVIRVIPPAVLTAQAASYGMLSFLNIAAFIGVNLAVFNLLPIPALDGCRVIFCIIEWIRKKPVNRKLETWVHFIGIIALFAFAILVDVIQLFV
jgi:hypothetical protein